jgi:hypothetical protein
MHSLQSHFSTSVDVLEQELLEVLLPDGTADLKRMKSDSAALTIWLPSWREVIRDYVSLLCAHTVDSIPALVRDLA